MMHAERVRRTLTFQKPDRYPVVHTPGSIGGTKERIDTIRKLYAEFPGDFADSVAFAGLVDPRKSPDEPYHREDTDEWGVRWGFDDPIIGGIAQGHPLADWSKLDGYKIPRAPLLDPAKRGDYERSLADLRGKGYPLGGNADGALFERLQWLRGHENILMDIAEGRKEVEVLADRILDEHMLPQIRECLKMGAWFIGFTDDWGTQTDLMINPTAWRRIFKPRYARMVQLCHENNAFLWMHSCGATTSIIPDLVEIGMDCFNAQGGANPPEKLREIGWGKMTFMTDIDHQKTLMTGTPAQVREEIRKLIATIGHPDGGVILRAFLQTYIPLPNCRAALEAFRDFGGLGR